jgi:dihydropteroate synthase
VPLSIDTTKAEVANFALNNGADLINDVSGLALDNAMLAIIKKHHCPCVIMHSQKNPVYSDVLQDIHSFFEQQIKRCLQESITQIILDPGIGFDKNLSDNLQILKDLDQFKRYGYPILIGTSRKSFIEKITGDSVHNRLEGSIASNMLAYQNGASIFRVHDVASIKKALQITQAILKS